MARLTFTVALLAAATLAAQGAEEMKALLDTGREKRESSPARSTGSAARSFPQAA